MLGAVQEPGATTPALSRMRGRGLSGISELNSTKMLNKEMNRIPSTSLALCRLLPRKATPVGEGRCFLQLSWGLGCMSCVWEVWPTGKGMSTV